VILLVAENLDWGGVGHAVDLVLELKVDWLVLVII
jgi:hypothetical protein